MSWPPRDRLPPYVRPGCYFGLSRMRRSSRLRTGSPFSLHGGPMPGHGMKAIQEVHDKRCQTWQFPFWFVATFPVVGHPVPCFMQRRAEYRLRRYFVRDCVHLDFWGGAAKNSKNRTKIKTAKVMSWSSSISSLQMVSYPATSSFQSQSSCTQRTESSAGTPHSCQSDGGCDMRSVCKLGVLLNLRWAKHVAKSKGVLSPVRR